MSMTMQIVHTITEASAASNKLFNAAHVFSSLNRKMIAPVDNQGNAQVFGIRCQVYSDAANTVTLKTAGNSYVTKQAVKAWYRVWRDKLREGGYTMKDLGPYGRVFKPRLESTQDILGSGGEAGRGEWNYSDVVTTPAQAVGGTSSISANELTDQFTLHLIGSSATEDVDDTRRYTNVGMIESWIGSRKHPAGADGISDVPESSVFDTDNPLLVTRGGALHSEMLLDEVQDLQKDEPPYDAQDFDGLYTQALIKTNADLSNGADIMAPCGLVKVTTTAACTLVFTLIGITDM